MPSEFDPIKTSPTAPMCNSFSRRALLGGGLAMMAVPLSGCYSVGLHDQPDLPDESFDYASAYAAWPDGDYTWPAINYKSFDRKFWRQVVDYKSHEKPGTIIVDPYNNFLYWTLSRKKALRYGIGVGRSGFAWSGEALIRVKREHPIWRPPQEMIARKPSLGRYWEKGMEPGLRNPLGAARDGPVARLEGHAVPHPRYQQAVQHRDESLLRLHPYVAAGRDRSLQSRAAAYQGHCSDEGTGGAAAGRLTGVFERRR